MNCKLMAVTLAVCMTVTAVPSYTTSAAEGADAVVILLSDEGVTVDGSDITTDSSQDVYVSTKIETHDDVSAEYAEQENTVITITDAGTYVVSGSITNGQLVVAAEDDDEVNVILNGTDITCNTAPALIVASGYDPQTEGQSGVIITLADGTINNLTGSHVAKYYDEDGNKVKYDAALSSDISFSINGTGTLNVVSDNEGIESKYNLTVESGIINVDSCDDGMNASEDGVSHLTINGGTLYINPDNGSEGDGLDSNGWITINGGTIYALSNSDSPDSGLDSDEGIIINGGTVIATGNMTDEVDSASTQQYIQLVFAQQQQAGTLVTITDTQGNPVVAFESENKSTFLTYSSSDLTEGTYYVYVGGEIAGVCEHGLYTEITSYTAGTQQMYTSLAGGMPTGAEGEVPEMPTGAEGEMPEMPTGAEGEAPEIPTGAEGEAPEIPTGAEGEAPEIPTGAEGGTGQSSEGSVEFVLTSSSHIFNGITDAIESDSSSGNDSSSDIDTSSDSDATENEAEVTVTSSTAEVTTDEDGVITVIPNNGYIQDISVDGITIQGHVQSEGWGDEGTLVGTVNKRLEAFRCTSDDSSVDVYYRAYVEGYGWLAWASNGEIAGTVGLSKKILKLQIAVVDAGESAPSADAYEFSNLVSGVSYSGHQQTYGNLSTVSDGEVLGYTGVSKRLEAVLLSSNITGLSLSVTAHVQSYGWLSATSGLVGTTGQSKRLEAYSISLTGLAADSYNVYYRAHVQTYGWSSWTSEGEVVGTTGQAKRIEAIQVVLESTETGVQSN